MALGVTEGVAKALPALREDFHLSLMEVSATSVRSISSMQVVQASCSMLVNTTHLEGERAINWEQCGQALEVDIGEVHSRMSASRCPIID
jgi:hypothetical protein